MHLCQQDLNVTPEVFHILYNGETTARRSVWHCAQCTGTTTAKAGATDHALAATVFPAPLLSSKRLPSWTPERPIALVSKVGSGETPRCEGGSRGRRAVCRSRSGRGRTRGSLLALWRERKSEFGRAQWYRFQLVPQFQEPRSKPTGTAVASTPSPWPNSCTTCRDQSPGLRLRVSGRNAPRCNYSSTTSQAVSRGSGRLVKKSS